MSSSNFPAEPIFSYSAAPQPVKPRSKFRNVSDEAGLTLMSDPRVRRGLTVGGTNSKSGSRGSTPGLASSGQAARFSKSKKATAASATGHTAPTQPTYTFTVPDFSGCEFNLEQYLVSSDDAKQTNNQHEISQTDEFAPLPPPAEYIPRKTGVDSSTQVEDQRELFNFDLEVKPMVEVIVRKTLEQALFELNSEDELKTLQFEVSRFNIEREAEETWMRLKELEMIEDNNVKEKERAGRTRVLMTELGVRRAVGAAAAMRQLMPSVLDGVVDELFREGVWRDEEKAEASTSILPALTKEASQRVNLYGIAYDMIEELLTRAQDVHFELGQVEHIKRKNVHVHITLSAKETGAEEDIFLGCFKLDPRSTLVSLEQDIQAKITEQKITIFSSLQKPLSVAFSKFTSGIALTLSLELLTLDVPQKINIQI